MTDGIQRNDIYEHLVSELKSERKVLSPKTFMEDYLPKDLRVPFRQHFEQRNIPMTQFSKDWKDIGNQLKRRTLVTVHGVNITAPAEGENLIEVSEDQIVINDALNRVGHK